MTNVTKTAVSDTSITCPTLLLMFVFNKPLFPLTYIQHTYPVSIVCTTATVGGIPLFHKQICATRISESVPHRQNIIGWLVWRRLATTHYIAVSYRITIKQHDILRPQNII